MCKIIREQFKGITVDKTAMEYRRRYAELTVQIHRIVRMTNGVYLKNKRTPYITSPSLFCTVGISAMVFPLSFLHFSVHAM